MTFEEAYQYRNVVRRVARGYLKDENDVEDVIQDVFSKVARRLDKNAPSHIVNYLRAATKNTCINLLRDRHRREARARKGAQGLPQGLAVGPRSPLGFDVGVLLSRLPKSSREVMELVIQGYTTLEISALLGKSERAITSKLSRIRAEVTDMSKGKLAVNPKLTISKGRVLANLKPVRDQLEGVGGGADTFKENIAIVGPFGPTAEMFGHDRSTCVLYLLQDPKDREKIAEAAKEGDFPLFQQYLPMSMRFGSGGTIGLFWKHPIARKYLVGALQYHFEDWKVGAEGTVRALVLTHMAVKPRYRKNKLNTLMIDYLRMEGDRGYDLVVFHDPTADGKAFMKAYGGEDYQDAVRRLGAR